jgi:hypothetical protein
MQGSEFSQRWLWRDILEYSATYSVESQLVFRRNILPPFQGCCYLLHTGSFPLCFPSPLTCRQLTLNKTAVWVIGHWAPRPRRGGGGLYCIYLQHNRFLTQLVRKEADFKKFPLYKVYHKTSHTGICALVSLLFILRKTNRSVTINCLMLSCTVLEI